MNSLFKKIFVLLFCANSLLFGTDGRFINPITDVCWECVFPITVSGVNVTPGKKDLMDYSKTVCICAGTPPKIGAPLTFWEPTRLVDVTRHAYKMLGIGGVSVGPETIKNRGSIGRSGDGGLRHSFYHVHWYSYPVFSLLEIFSDFVCIDKGCLDMLYMTELDPMWNNDQLSILINAEAALFGNPLAQLACIADCTAASFYKPIDKLFWCAGCSGSLYPFTGNVGHHTGGIQASTLLVHRMIAKLHRGGLVKGYDDNDFCQAKYMPIIKKSLYKTQLAYPIPQTIGGCHPLGETTVISGAGRSFPVFGEDFVYIVWTKKQCCLDCVKPATAVIGGGL